MNGKDLFLGLEHLDTKYIDLAESGEFSLDAFYQEEKEDTIHHSKVDRFLLLAAIIALISALVGCGIVYMLKMQDFTIGETEIVAATEVDAEGDTNMITESVQILTLSGVKGSANYQAAQDWLEFEEQYDPDYEIAREAYKNPATFPAEFDAYPIYTQDQADKLLEIVNKYNLTLAGPSVNARTPKSLLAYLNIDSLLQPTAQAELSNLTVKYYENGKFYANFYLLMEESNDSWPYDTFCLYYYTPKTCFDDHFVYLSETADWREWNYTTASGEPVLILRSDSRKEAYILRDQENATAAVKIYMEYFDSVMTDQQLQQMVDQFHFALNPVPGDPAILNGFGGNVDSSVKMQTQNGCTMEVKSVETDGEIAYITLGVTAPEDIILAGYDLHPGNRGEGLMLPQEGSSACPGLNANWISEDDGDGCDNTQNLVIIADANTMDGSAFQENGLWNIYIEGLDISNPGSMLQKDVLHHIDGVWQFDVSFESADFHYVEFIEEPLHMNLSVGMGNYADVQLISLQLRRFSATAVFADGSGDLNDYKNNTETCVTLKDGREIPIHHVGGPGNGTGLRFEGEIPIETIAYVTLIDGTTLYPQE